MTTHDTDIHRPTEAFRDYLEGEVVHTFRRRRTFRRLRAAAVIVVSMGIGMTTTLASAQVRGNAQRDSLLEAARADVALASTRLQMAKLQVEEEQSLVNVGARPSTALTTVMLQLQAAEQEMARTHLNVEEIEASSLPPRDELNAPLVNGKDFVKRRLELQAMMAGRRLEMAERDRGELARRVSVGAATELELAEAEMASVRARADFAVLAERLRARSDFLLKATPMQELADRIERVEAQHAVMIAQRALDNARRRLDLLEKRQQVGAATKLDVMKARVDVSEREIELQKTARRLKQIKVY